METNMLPLDELMICLFCMYKTQMTLQKKKDT